MFSSLSFDILEILHFINSLFYTSNNNLFLIKISVKDLMQASFYQA